MQALKPSTAPGLLADSLRRMAPLSHQQDEESNSTEIPVGADESEIECWSAVNEPLGLNCASNGTAGSSSNRRKQTKPSRMADNKAKGNVEGKPSDQQAGPDTEETAVSTSCSEEGSVDGGERSEEDDNIPTKHGDMDQDLSQNQEDTSLLSSSPTVTVSNAEAISLPFKFKCSMCSLNFLTEFDLASHFQEYHVVTGNRTAPSAEDNLAKKATPEQHVSMELETKHCSKEIEQSVKNNVDHSSHLNSISAESMASAVAAAAAAGAQQYSTGGGSNRDEDYCDLCQKHFCNKYYLRKHKNDVHGIVTDQTFGGNRSNASTTPKKEYHHMPTVLSSMPPFALHSPMSAAGAHPSHPMFLSPHMMNAANFMLFHPFAAGSPVPLMNPAHFLPMAPPTTLGQHSLFSPSLPSHSLALQISSQSSGTQSTPNNAAVISSPSGGQTSGTGESKVKSGSDNEGAFCPICNVEECNKYFLRIHMATKHGIKDESETCPDSQQQTISSALPSTPTSSSAAPTALINVSTSHTVSWEPNSSSPPSTFSIANNNNNNKIVSSTNQVKDESSSLNEPENLCLPKQQQVTPLDMFSASSSMKLDNPFVGSDAKLSADLMACYSNRQIDPEAFCTLCNREFANKYTLKIHILNMHTAPGVCPTSESEAAAAAVAMFSSANMAANSNAVTSIGGLPPPPTHASGAVLSPPIDAFKNSMIAAKLADRVTCDICQKDLCNKYFLKTHKMKVHGVMTPSDSKPNSPPRSNDCPTGLSDDANSNQDPTSRPLYLGLSGAGVQAPQQPHQQQTSPKPPPQQPTTPKASILPSHTTQQSSPLDMVTSEVYCELCKKEVGPKYLFRNHMLTVHGIGGGDPSGMAGFLNSLPGAGVSSGQGTMIPPYRTNSVASNDSSAYNGHATPLQFTGSMSLGSPGGRSNSTCGGGKWSRESPNQMRVLCDICDKWICNKYFLRTHKLNKHGIVTPGMTPTPKQISGLPSTPFSGPGLLPSSSVSADPSGCITNASPLCLTTSVAATTDESGLISMPPLTAVTTSASNSPTPATINSQDGAASDCSGGSRKPASAASLDATIDAVISSNSSTCAAAPTTSSAADLQTAVAAAATYFPAMSHEAMAAAAARFYTQDYLAQHYGRLRPGNPFDPRLFLPTMSSSAVVSSSVDPAAGLTGLLPPPPLGATPAGAAAAVAMAATPCSTEGMPICTLCGLLCPDNAKLHKHIEQVHSRSPLKTESGDPAESSPLNLCLPRSALNTTTTPLLTKPTNTNQYIISPSKTNLAALRSVRKARLIRWKHQHQLQEAKRSRQHHNQQNSKDDQLEMETDEAADPSSRVLLWRYECGECGASFQSRLLLQRHVTEEGHWMGRAVEVSEGEKHQTDNFLRCPLCSAQVVDLVQHLLKQHDLEREANLFRRSTNNENTTKKEDEDSSSVSPQIEFELTELNNPSSKSGDSNNDGEGHGFYVDQQVLATRPRALACERVTLPVREMVREPLLVRLNPLLTIADRAGVVQE